MTRRTPTLLEFGIAASVAVVPVLLGVLLLVAWLRPLAEAKTTTPEGERHVSARLSNSLLLAAWKRVNVSTGFCRAWQKPEEILRHFRPGAFI